MTAVIVTAKAHGLLFFDLVYDIATERCLTAKNIVETLANRLFNMLVTNFLYKRKI